MLVSRGLCAHDALEPPLVHSTNHSTWIGQGAWPSAARAGKSVAGKAAKARPGNVHKSSKHDRKISAKR